MKKLLLACPLLLAGLALWPGRPGGSGSGDDARGTPPDQRTPPAAAAGSRHPRESGREPESLRRLLDRTGDLLERIGRLGSGDTGQFEEIARLTNEFENGLDAATAERLVKFMPGDFPATSLGDISLRVWATADRAAAAAWMAAHPSPSPVAASALVHGWFAEDKEAMAGYLASLPDGVWKTHVIASAAGEALAAGSARETVRMLDLGAGTDPHHQELYEWAAVRWGLADPAAAVAWASDMQDPRQQQRLLASVHVGHANVDPVAAAAALLDQVEDPEVALPAIGSIVRVWANQEPEEAARWVAGFPPGPEQSLGLAQLLAVWGPVDSGAADEWIMTLADPSAKREAGEILRRVRSESAGNAGAESR